MGIYACCLFAHTYKHIYIYIKVQLIKRGVSLEVKTRGSNWFHIPEMQPHDAFVTTRMASDVLLI